MVHFLLVVAFMIPSLFAQDSLLCSEARENCRPRCASTACREDGYRCQEGRIACLKYCATELINSNCQSDVGSIKGPRRCRSLINQYTPGRKDGAPAQATCSSDSDCLLLVNDLIIKCGASPLCVGRETETVSPRDAANCALEDAERRMEAQRKKCGGYRCTIPAGFKNDRHFFGTLISGEDNAKGLSAAKSQAKKEFKNFCHSNVKDPNDLKLCLIQAGQNMTCTYWINIEGDGCFYDDQESNQESESKATK